LENRTSIEGFLIRRHQEAYKDCEKRFRWVFDFGIRSNLKSFYGSSPYDWFALNVSEHTRKASPYVWQCIPIPDDVVALLEKQDNNKKNV